MRAPLALLLTLGLAACSGVPPQPIVPLPGGAVALGLTVDVPVSRGARVGGFSLWTGVGAGGGVDVAFGIDAPFELVAELGAVGRGDRPFVPPSVAVRKSFGNGVGVGFGVASSRLPLQKGTPHRGLVQMTIGPFVSVGSPDAEAPVAARASAHLVYEVHVARRDSLETVRRGVALYGLGAGGPVLWREAGAVVAGGRAVVGGWLAAPHGVGVSAGPFAEGAGR